MQAGRDIHPHSGTTSSAATGPESRGSTAGVLFLPGASQGWNLGNASTAKPLGPPVWGDHTLVLLDEGEEQPGAAGAGGWEGLGSVLV